MSGLILNMPRVAIMMLIGMAGMFLAPFGMLISKWAVLKAWWMPIPFCPPSSSLAVPPPSSSGSNGWQALEVFRPRERIAESSAWAKPCLYGLSAASFLTCLFFPLISTALIEP